MADTIITQILDDVVSTISAITAGATYSRTVNYCTRLTHAPQELGEFDAVLVFDAGCFKTVLASNQVQCTQLILLDCWTRTYNETEDATDQLAADVEKALLTDPTRGALAIDTNVLAVRKAVFLDRQPEGNCEIDIEIKYRHAFGDPYSTP